MKRILITLASLLLAGAAQAQFGIRVGGNVATLSTKTDSEFFRADAKGRTGYQMGVFYEQKFTDRLSLVPEVQFSRQAINLKAEEFGIADGGYDADYLLRLSYLNVPVLVRATFGRFYVEAGPQLGVLQSAHEKGGITYGTFTGTRQEHFDRLATDSYRRIDFDLSAGVGAKLPAGFGISIRGYTGLLSLTHVPQFTRYSGDLKNRVVQASLTYQLASQ